MKRYVISGDRTLYQALRQMNNNKVKYLIAVHENGKILGTLTDGDIRRGLLNGMQLQDSIEPAVYRAFTFVREADGLSEVLRAFQGGQIEFLPVLDEADTLKNIITRRALNVLLLKNQAFSIAFDFTSLDEHELEHEIFARPWGFYKTTVLNEMFQSKVIYIMPGQALSLQSHQRREEYWIITNGAGFVQIGESIHPVVPGSTCFIPKGCKHRMTNTSGSEVLIITEVQLGDYFGEDDIYRFEDQYGRI